MGKLNLTGGIQTTLDQTNDVLRQPEREGSSEKEDKIITSSVVLDFYIIFSWI